MVRQLKFLSLGYFLCLVIFSFLWPKLYVSGHHYKGDDIFFCLEITPFFTLAYSILVKVIDKRYPLWLVITMPILVSFLAIVVGICITVAFHLNDYAGLQVYFYLHGLIAIGMVWGVVHLR